MDGIDYLTHNWEGRWRDCQTEHPRTMKRCKKSTLPTYGIVAWALHLGLGSVCRAKKCPQTTTAGSIDFPCKWFVPDGRQPYPDFLRLFHMSQYFFFHGLWIGPSPKLPPPKDRSGSWIGPQPTPPPPPYLGCKFKNHRIHSKPS